MSIQRTKEQERAQFAWERVKAVSQNQKEFKSLAQSAPADIQANGLAQTLAFWRAKWESHHQALYRAVSDWVMKEMGLPGQDLLEWIINPNTGSDLYRQATAEAMAFLVWVKRFAEAEFK
jgi:CRISPR-associated protein Cmr5